MDECILDDLLECSVCLERLDTSSKVLPCQHTFCKKCLEEILRTHSELRCPECRILVDTRIEDLPPNVLLMRILEGLGSAGRRTILRNNSNNIQGNVKSSPQQTATTGQHVIQSPQQTQSPPTQPTVYQNLPYARANYDYLSKEPGDLSFRKGDIILLRKKIDNNWYLGEISGNQGVFPLSYVQVVVPLPTQVAAQCKALFDFKIFQDQEDGCLVFHKGDVITVMRRVDENWAEGKLGEKIGIFPLAFVELNPVAKSLIKNYPIETQAGATRVVPPTPTTRDDANSTANPPNQIPPSHYHPKGKALFDFKICNDEEDSCLVFHKGDVITVMRRVDENWAEGKLGEKIGIFPIGFVELNNVAKILLKQSLHENQAGPSRVTPPTPSSRDDSSNTNITQQIQQVSLVGLPPPATSDSSSTSLTSPSSTSSSTTINTSSSSHSSPSSPPPPPPAPNKRHSFGTIFLHNGTTLKLNRHSAEILNLPDGFIPAQSSLNVDVMSVEQHCQLVRHGSQRHRRINSSDIAPIPGPQLQHASLQLPASYVALYPYKPQKGDELELKRGAVYTVTERCQDGWFKGTAARGQKAGVFPGNYVAPAKSLPALQAQVKGFCRNSTTTLGGPSRNGTPPIEPRGLITYTKPTTNTTTTTNNQSTQATADPIRNATQANDSQSTIAAPPNVTMPATTKSTDKIQSRDKKEKSTVSLMRRLANIKKSKSPPPTPYSLDNPVFEDLSLLTPQHVHIRSGSCPNQLLTSTNLETPHRIFSPTSSHRSKPRERPSIARITPRMNTGSSSPSGIEHRKSNSMDNQTMVTPQDINSISTIARVSGGDDLSGSRGDQVPPAVSRVHDDLLIPPPPVRPNHPESTAGAQTRINSESSGTADIDVKLPTGMRRHSTEQACDTKVQTPTRNPGNTHAPVPHKSFGTCKNQTTATHHTRERFRCIVPYPPNSEYELELRLGDIIYVHKKREDGWYKGTQQRTGRTGLFPASFVQSF